MKLYVVIDVGCHECGVSSEAVGITDSPLEAEALAEGRDFDTDGWREGGQTKAQVFELEWPGNSAEGKDER